MTRRSRRFSASIGCFCSNRFGNNGNFYIVHEVEVNLNFLRPLAAGLVRRKDNDLLDILVDDSLCQFFHVHIFVCQSDKGVQALIHFFPLFHPFLDIAELGLSVQAAKNLYTGKVNAEVVNRLLENKNFAAMTNMIAHYFDDTLAAGYAAQNQMYATLSALLMGEAKQHPEDREAITETAKTVSVSRMPMYQADLTAIQNTFLNMLKEIKKEIGSNVSDAQSMSKEAAQQMYAELTKGQDVTKLNVTPEMVAEAITGSVSGMDGVAPEALKQFNQALIGLLTVKPTEDEHDGS